MESKQWSGLESSEAILIDSPALTNNIDSSIMSNGNVGGSNSFYTSNTTSNNTFPYSDSIPVYSGFIRERLTCSNPTRPPTSPSSFNPFLQPPFTMSSTCHHYLPPPSPPFTNKLDPLLNLVARILEPTRLISRPILRHQLPISVAQPSAAASRTTTESTVPAFNDQAVLPMQRCLLPSTAFHPRSSSRPHP